MGRSSGQGHGQGQNEGQKPVPVPAVGIKAALQAQLRPPVQASVVIPAALSARGPAPRATGPAPGQGGGAAVSAVFAVSAAHAVSAARAVLETPAKSRGPIGLALSLRSVAAATTTPVAGPRGQGRNKGLGADVAAPAAPEARPAALGEFLSARPAAIPQAERKRAQKQAAADADAAAAAAAADAAAKVALRPRPAPAAPEKEIVPAPLPSTPIAAQSGGIAAAAPVGRNALLAAGPLIQLPTLVAVSRRTARRNPAAKAASLEEPVCKILGASASDMKRPVTRNGGAKKPVSETGLGKGAKEPDEKARMRLAVTEKNRKRQVALLHSSRRRLMNKRPRGRRLS